MSSTEFTPGLVVGMIRTFERMSDLLLRLVVPRATANAGCITDPYKFCSKCYCFGNDLGWVCYYRLCHVASNCTTTCESSTFCRPICP